MFHTPTENEPSPLSRDIHLLGDLLGETLLAQEGETLYQSEETVRALAKARRDGDTTATAALSAEIAQFNVETLNLIALAFTAYFDLVNLAEEQHRVRVLREREGTIYPEPGDESIARGLADVSAPKIFPPRRLAALLERLQIELVFTAHPTEPRRRTLLSKLARMADVLYELERQDLLPRRREEWLQHLREKFIRTGSRNAPARRARR